MVECSRFFALSLPLAFDFFIMCATSEGEPLSEVCRSMSNFDEEEHKGRLLALWRLFFRFCLDRETSARP